MFLGRWEEPHTDPNPSWGSNWRRRSCEVITCYTVRRVPGAEGEVGSREAVYPGETLLLAHSAQHALFVPLGRDVLLPLTLAVTVFPTQAAVETVLTHKHTNEHLQPRTEYVIVMVETLKQTESV